MFLQLHPPRHWDVKLLGPSLSCALGAGVLGLLWASDPTRAAGSCWEDETSGFGPDVQPQAGRANPALTQGNSKLSKTRPHLRDILHLWPPWRRLCQQCLEVAWLHLLGSGDTRLPPATRKACGLGLGYQGPMRGFRLQGLCPLCPCTCHASLKAVSERMSGFPPSSPGWGGCSGLGCEDCTVSLKGSRRSSQEKP